MKFVITEFDCNVIIDYLFDRFVYYLNLMALSTSVITIDVYSLDQMKWYTLYMPLSKMKVSANAVKRRSLFQSGLQYLEFSPQKPVRPNGHTY